MKSLAVTFGCLLAANNDLDRLRDFHAYVFRDPGIENVGRADAEGYAADRAHVRGVRVGADIQLAGQSVTFENDRMADAFRAFAVF